MEEKQQHCSGTVLFQALEIKWEAIKGTLVPNNPLTVGRGKERGLWFLTKLQFYAPYDGDHIVWFKGIPLSRMRIPQDYVWESEALRPKPYRITKVCPMIRNHKTSLNTSDTEDFTSSCFMAKGEPSCFSFLTISSMLFPEKRLEGKNTS